MSFRFRKIIGQDFCDAASLAFSPPPDFCEIMCGGDLGGNSCLGIEQFLGVGTSLFCRGLVINLFGACRYGNAMPPKAHFRIGMKQLFFRQ